MFSYRCSIRAWLRGQSLRALQLLDGATARARTGEVFVPLLQRPYGVFAPNSEILVIKNRKPPVVCAEEFALYNELCRCFYQCVIRFNFVTSDYIGDCRYHLIACFMSIVLAILGLFPSLSSSTPQCFHKSARER